MSGNRFHIVVLEDNEADLFIIRQSLGRAIPECDITSFADGAETLAYLNRPTSRVADLVILDFNVPGVEGASVLNSVRGNPRWAHAGVFMFHGFHKSGRHSARQKARCRRLCHQTNGPGRLREIRAHGWGLAETKSACS